MKGEGRWGRSRGGAGREKGTERDFEIRISEAYSASRLPHLGASCKRLPLNLGEQIFSITQQSANLAHYNIRPNRLCDFYNEKQNLIVYVFSYLPK